MTAANLRRRYEAATQGEWKQAVWYGADEGGWAAIGPHHKYTDDEDHGDDEPGGSVSERAEADAALIVAMHKHLPRLLAIAEAAEAWHRENHYFAGKEKVTPAEWNAATLRYAAASRNLDDALRELHGEGGPKHVTNAEGDCVPHLCKACGPACVHGDNSNTCGLCREAGTK